MRDERDQFGAHVQAVYNEVGSRDDQASIEIEAVYPRIPIHVVLYFIHPERDQGYELHCGKPIIERLDEDTVVLTPQKDMVQRDTRGAQWAHLKDGIDVFTSNHVSGFRRAGPPSFVHNGSVKVYVAVENTKTNQYHLFARAKSTAEVKDIARTYHQLAQTVEEDNAPHVPNYLLKSARDLNKQLKGDDGGAVPKLETFEPVIQQLCNKAKELEGHISADERPSYSFENDDFKAVYQRFKYLAAANVGVTEHPKTMAVDISSLDARNSTRLTMTGKPMFDAFCEAYKRLAPLTEIVETIMQRHGSYEVVDKRSVKDLKSMADGEVDTNDYADAVSSNVCFGGFKLNVKREHAYEQKDARKALMDLLDDQSGHDHLYRYKQRYSFGYKGYTIDLTMVRSADRDRYPSGKGKDSPLRSTPFIALDAMRNKSDKYELEIERMDANAAVEDLFHLIGECTHAMNRHVAYFGKHVHANAYPRILDTQATRSITARFNAMPCHVAYHRSKEAEGTGPNDTAWATGHRLNDQVSPNVVNMTHAKYEYVRHHWHDYLILTKTDGYHCVAFVHKASQALYLYIQKGRSCMAIGLAAPVSADYVLDGEFYSKDGIATFYVFDVYAKGNASTLGDTLPDRLAALTDPLTPAHTNLRVVVKTALTLGEYQRLYRLVASNSSDLTQEDRTRFQAFECRRDGVKADNDGYILMHAGPLVRDCDEDEEVTLVMAHGTKPYVMRAHEFQHGRHSVNEMTRRTASYALCLKWKPEEECTIDFKVYLDTDHEHGQTKRRVRLCSKYRADETTEVNLYHVLCGMYGSPAWGRRSLTPQDQHQPQPFLPANAYDYELVQPMHDSNGTPGVWLTCDVKGVVNTERREVIKDNAIVEMRYTRQTGEWVPMRLRRDKTEPNAYRVALDNWRNIFHPVVSPDRWLMGEPEMYDPSMLDVDVYYAHVKKTAMRSQVDNAHVLLKQYVILKATRVWGASHARAALKVYDLGCGKGTDLFHWNAVHQHVRPIRFYLGTDYDHTNLVRHHDGACYRYLLGGRHGPPRGNGHSAPRGLTAQSGYKFDAVFAQADARRALSTCKDGAWSNSDPTTRPTDHKFHYQVLSHVLYGTPAAEPRLAQVLDDRTVHPVYNLVSCQFAMHHFAQPKSGLWRNLRQVLTSDGLFVATVPNGDFLMTKLAATGQYVVPIHDAKTGQRVPWYRYETDDAREGHVHFETPKINRNEEPLLTEEALRTAVAKAQLDIVMVEPFGTFVDACGLPCYTHACWAFDKHTFDTATLTHIPHATTPKMTETAEALEYSREGHWVVVLCQRGRTEGERAKLREALLAAGDAA